MYDQVLFDDLSDQLLIARQELGVAKDKHKAIYDRWQEELTKKLEVTDDLNLICDHIHDNPVAHHRLESICKQLGLDSYSLWNDDSQDHFVQTFGAQFHLGYQADVTPVMQGIIAFVELFGDLARNSEGWTWHDFMENGLSSKASYHLEYNGGTARVAESRYGPNRYVCEGSLKQCLTFISHNLWYGEPHSYTHLNYQH